MSIVKTPRLQIHAVGGNLEECSEYAENLGRLFYGHSRLRVYMSTAEVEEVDSTSNMAGEVLTSSVLFRVLCYVDPID